MDNASSGHKSGLSAAVSAALRDLDYFNRFTYHLVENEKRRDQLFEELWEENLQITSVVALTWDYSDSEITEEALRQINQRQATGSAATLTPTSSPGPLQQDDANPVGQGNTTFGDSLAEHFTVPTFDTRLPISAPFRIQHRLAVALQSTMEAACFAVAQKHLPELLRERNWAYPEAATFSAWLDALNSYPDSPARLALALTDSHVESVMVLYKTVVVERIPLPLESLMHCVRDAFNIMRPLETQTFRTVTRHVPNFWTVSADLLSHVDTFQKIVNAQGTKLDEAMAGIAVKRAALEAEEAAALQIAKDAIAEYEAKWDAEYQAALST